MLHHGTLLVDLNFEDMVAALSVDPEKYRSKGVASVRARVTNISECWQAGSTMDDQRAARAACCAPESVPLDVPEDALREAERLAEETYRTWEWNFGRSPAFSERRRRRFPWGLVDVLLDVRKGVIESCRIHGDFFAAADVRELESRLTGVRDEPQALRQAVRDVDWEACFSGCDPEVMQNFFTHG